MLLIFLSFFVFQAFCVGQNNLPFDDEDPGDTEPSDDFVNDDEQEPTPMPTISIPPIQPHDFLEVIGAREILVLCVFVLYIVFFILGKRSIKKYLTNTIEKSCTFLEKYYKAVPKRLVSNSLHRFDSFSTGRATHLGCLTTLSLSRRCDILGFLYDKFNKAKSTLTFEVIIEQAQDLPLIFHVSDTEPKFTRQFKLLNYPINDAKLKCYSDFEESTEIFVPEVNEFLEKHPGLVSLIEISDANRFELRTECRFVVCVQFNLDGFEEAAFSEEAVDFVMKLADHYATLQEPRDILERMQRTRHAIIDEQKAALEKEGYNFENKKEKKE